LATKRSITNEHAGTIVTLLKRANGIAIENMTIPYAACKNAALVFNSSRSIPTCIADKMSEKKTNGINAHEKFRSKKGIYRGAGYQYPVAKRHR
jgi:hypothetical protein